MAYSISISTKPLRKLTATAALRVCSVAVSILAACAQAVVASTVLYDSGDPPQGPGPSLFSDQWLAQPFTPTANWDMTQVGVFAGGAGPITLSLAADDAGLPGSILGTWTIANNWDAGGSWGYTDADFTFAQGSNYWFEYTSSADVFNGDFLPTPAPNGISDIAISSDQGQTWSIAQGAGPLGLRIENAPAPEVPEPRMIVAMIGGLGMLILRQRRKSHASGMRFLVDPPTRRATRS